MHSQVHWQIAATWDPDMETAKRQKLLKQWSKAVERTLNWEDDKN